MRPSSELPSGHRLRHDPDLSGDFELDSPEKDPKEQLSPRRTFRLLSPPDARREKILWAASGPRAQPNYRQNRITGIDTGPQLPVYRMADTGNRDTADETEGEREPAPSRKCNAAGCVNVVVSTPLPCSSPVCC